jgi:hypothetical protein
MRRLMMISSLGKRAMVNLLPVVDVKIEQFNTKFSELKLALQERAIVQTEITAWRVLERVENIGLYLSLLKGCLLNIAHGCRCGNCAQ